MYEEEKKALIKSYQEVIQSHITPGAIGTYYEGIIKFKAKVVSVLSENGWFEVEFECLEMDRDFPKVFKASRRDGYEGYCGWNFILDVERN